jgi:hypothetical protein
MPDAPASLSRRLAWTRVLGELGAPVEATFLPQIAVCTICCKKTLHVFTDDLLGGQWAHCTGCGFAGDMIELAAAAWNLDVPAAIGKLQNLSLAGPFAGEQVQGYLDHHLGFRRRVSEFWEAARRELSQGGSPCSRMLLRKFGIVGDVGLSTWAAGGGQFVGAASHKQIEDLFRPGSQLFQDKSWEEVLVTPFYDFPGRICGFLLFGDEGKKPEGDWAYMPLHLSSGSAPGQAGLGTYSTLFAGPHPQFGDTTFVLDNPFVALRLQLRHLRSSFTALPIVIAHYDHVAETRDVWRQAPARDWIFWGTHPAILRQAKAARGRVSTYQLTPAMREQGLRGHEPQQWLQLVRKEARSWQSVLRAELDRATATGAEELLVAMEMSPDECRGFIAESPDQLRAKLERVNPDRLSHRRVHFGQRTVVESDTGWHLLGTDEQICNATLRIEEVLHCGADRIYYRGFARMNGEDHPFTVDGAAVKRQGLLRVVHDALLRSGAGVLNYEPRWNKQSAYIAMQLHPPDLVTGANRIGWRPEGLSFVFPKFSIRLGGEIATDRLPICMQGPAPAEHLRPPEGLAKREVDLLCHDLPEIRLTWALMAAVVHNLLSAVMSHPPIGVLLVGELAQHVGRQIAGGLGCAEAPRKSRTRRQSVLEMLQEMCGRHDWPVLLQPAGRRQAAITADWLLEPALNNAIVPTGQVAAWSLAAHRDFHIIRDGGPVRVPQIGQRTHAKLVPGYLQDLAKRKLDVTRRTNSRLQDVLYDIGDWFERACGGDRQSVLDAGAVVEAAGQIPVWRRFVDIVSLLIDEGEMAEVPQQAAHDNPHAGLIFAPAEGSGPETIWISQQAVNEQLVRRHALPLDQHTVFASIQDVSAFVKYENVAGKPGWAMDQAWWDKAKVRREPSPVVVQRSPNPHPAGGPAGSNGRANAEFVQ